MYNSTHRFWKFNNNLTKYKKKRKRTRKESKFNHGGSTLNVFLSSKDDFLCIVFSAESGCSLSGDNARRNNGDPGSVFCFENECRLTRPWLEPALFKWEGIVFCGWFEAPAWWVWPTAKGLGLRVGETGIGEGEGVLARGDNGMLCTDFLRWGDFKLWVRLCFKPARVLGRL